MRITLDLNKKLVPSMSWKVIEFFKKKYLSFQIANAIDNVNINIAQHPNNIIIWVIIFINFIILYLIVITLSIE